ncbi:MAG: biopolymer transporter ExbD [Chloracidobacterium sp.]|nr:biopolymer transporter ExbD [Chloracidobacterium sp.]
MENNDQPARFMKLFLIWFGLLIFLLNASGCSSVRLQLNQFKEDKRANLPRNMRSASEDIDITKENSCVITLDNSGKFLIGKEEIAEAGLTEKIIEKLEDKTPDKRIVYIESPVNVGHQTIVKLFDAIRKAGIDRAGLVAYRENYDKPGVKPSMFEVKLPAEPKPEDAEIRNPNPLSLVVSIDRTGKLSLNNEPMGNVSDPDALTDKLTEIFKYRTSNGVFQPFTNEIEATVFVKASKSLKYGDVVKVIDAVKLAGADPIGMQIDDLSV